MQEGLVAWEPTPPQRDLPAAGCGYKRGLQRQVCPLTDSPRDARQSLVTAGHLRTWRSPRAGLGATYSPAGFSGSSVSKPIKYTCSQNCILSVCLLTPPLLGHQG